MSRTMRWCLSVAVAMLLALLCWPITSGVAASVPTGVPMPNSRLTPGEAFPRVTAAQVCVPGYAKSVRSVSNKTKTAVYKEYDITHHKSGEYEVDHLISLELGGDNSIKNLWPEPYNNPYGAHLKDHLEDYLHAAVCAGRESLAKAQHDIATNWYAAWIAAGRPGASGVSKSAPALLPTARPIAPTQTALSSALIASLSVSPNPVVDNQPATLTVTSVPGATCMVGEVLYASGRTARSASLTVPQVVDSSGSASWTWTPETKYPGAATATVSCSKGGQEQTQTLAFTVQ